MRDEGIYHATVAKGAKVDTKVGERGGLSGSRSCGMRRSVSCDLEADKRFWFSRSDSDDLSGVTGCCSRSVCDDGDGLARPTGQIGAQLHNST